MSPVIPANDVSLLRLLQSDPELAIERIYKTHQPALVRSAYRLVRDQETARDLVQDVFINFWKGRQKLVVQTSIAAYLHRSVINASLNYLQKQPGATAAFAEPAQPPHPIPTPEQELQAGELSLAVDRAVSQLPVRCRMVFALNRFEQLSYKEIAASLNISPKAVEKEMMKALRLLRQSLKDYLPLLLVMLLA